MNSVHQPLFFFSVLVLFFCACGKEANTLWRLKGRWQAISVVENGVELPAQENLQMYYSFERCSPNMVCHVEIGISSQGQNHPLDTETFTVSHDGSNIYFGNQRWKIQHLERKKLEIERETDAFRIYFEKD